MRQLAMIAVAALLAGCASDTMRTPPSHGMTMKSDIVDTAVAAGSFGTLATALGAAGLVDTLKSPGPFTVFAPTDAAFAALPAGTVDTLLMPQNKAQLTDILTYHVIPGRFAAADLIGKNLNVTTVQGTTVNIDATGNGVLVDGVPVTMADVEASNGIIHVIGSVLMP